MESMVLVAALLVAFSATLLAVPVVRLIAMRRGWVDFPDLDRKVHRRPTPNTGGLAVAIGFFSGLISLRFFAPILGVAFQPSITVLAGGALFMLLSGLYDDIHRLGFKKKFVLQIAVAYAMLVAGYRIDVSGLAFLFGDSYSEALLSVPLTLLWIVGVVNAVNLLDGLDGLAAGVSMIAFACFGIVLFQNGGAVAQLSISFLMVGALCGFLVYNFHPASIFLGDSGSLFIGFLLAVYPLQGPMHANPNISLVVPVIALGLPILDTVLCFVRRLLDGRSPYSPDSDHIHHRLDRLFSHRKAVYVLYVAALWFSTAAFLVSRSSQSLGVLIAAVTIVSAYAGIRTLGYLDLNLFPFYRIRKPEQLSFDFEPDEGGGREAPHALRRTHHHDVLISHRTLPVRYKRPRAPWHRSIGDGDQGELVLELDERISATAAGGESNGVTNGTA
jgi:UDP-GlcNAc:undecaprenyl-phosphate GlcNAc-1-phosphate transferase